jgi:hypothetical protein
VKFMKTLLLAMPLLLLPIASSAGLLDGIGDLLDDTTTAPSVPEPSGALVMGVALVTVVAAKRRLGK